MVNNSMFKAKEEREAVYGVMQQVQNRLKVSPNDGSRGRNEEEDFFERVQEEFFRQEYLWKLLTNRRQALEEDIWQKYHIHRTGSVSKNHT